jgi:hypothetical protein
MVTKTDDTRAIIGRAESFLAQQSGRTLRAAADPTSTAALDDLCVLLCEMGETNRVRPPWLQLPPQQADIIVEAYRELADAAKKVNGALRLHIPQVKVPRDTLQIPELGLLACYAHKVAASAQEQAGYTRAGEAHLAAFAVSALKALVALEPLASRLLYGPHVERNLPSVSVLIEALSD